MRAFYIWAPSIEARATEAGKVQGEDALTTYTFRMRFAWFTTMLKLRATLAGFVS